MKLTDRRTNRTRRQLREALLALILEKGYDALTIADITHQADLGRTTFYLHYKDKEELLLESIDTLADDLKAQIGLVEDQALPAPGALLAPRELAPGAAIELVFRHSAENATLYRVILNGGAASRALLRLQEIISAAAQLFFIRRMPPAARPPDFPPGIILHYFASSLLGLVNWWLQADMPYPPETMAQAFVGLFFGGAQQAIGLPALQKPD
jgi:AcrR family transcriptional regulator